MEVGYFPSVFVIFKAFPIKTFPADYSSEPAFRHLFFPFVHTVYNTRVPAYLFLCSIPFFNPFKRTSVFTLPREAADGFIALLSDHPFTQAGTVWYEEQHPLHLCNEFLPSFFTGRIFPKPQYFSKMQRYNAPPLAVTGHFILTNGVPRKSSYISSSTENVAYLPCHPWCRPTPAISSCIRKN